MTANQIAYAGIEEEKRHNQISEGELNRHNVATESLDQQKVEIDRERVEVDRHYKSRSLDLEDKWKAAYLAVQKSQGDEKLRLQSELNRITSNKNELENWYNQQQVELKAKDQGIAKDRQAEDARHNKVMESISSNYNFMHFALENKRVEYQNTYWRDSISNQLLDLSRKERELNFSNLITERYGVPKMEAETSKLSADAARTQKDTWWMDWNYGPGSLFNGLGIKVLGGH